MSVSSIYLDHNSTTPIDPRVVEAMARAWRDCGGNPASQHSLGRKARRTLEEAREGILELLGAKAGGMDADQLIFTSGGTEANNLALFGLAPPHRDTIVISAIEHPSIKAAAAELKRRGCYVIETDVDETGQINIEDLKKRFFSPLPKGEFSSLMLANNETGLVLPVTSHSGHDEDWYTHTDAVQAVGKIPVHFRELDVDAMTVAPHKFHGPLGIGALMVRHGIRIQPQLFGGFQQGGLRAGTENVALAVGFQEALKIAVAELPERAARMQSLRDELEGRLRVALPDMVVIGERAPRLPNTSCVAFPGIDRQALVMALDLAGVACSTGSACASGSSEPSPTLIAMGLERSIVDSAIRLSLGAFTTAAEVAEASERIIKAVKHLRREKSP